MVADSAVHREKIAEKLIKSKDGLKRRGGKWWPRVTSARGTANKTRGETQSLRSNHRVHKDAHGHERGGAGLSSVRWTVNSGDEELIFTFYSAEPFYAFRRIYWPVIQRTSKVVGS